MQLNRMDDHPNLTLEILRADAHADTAAEHLEVGLRVVKQKSGLKSKCTAGTKKTS